MKQNRFMFVALAIAALLMTACNKEPQGFDSFIINTGDFNDANGSKAHWDDAGYWWESDSTDYVLINGDVHYIYREGTNTWKTHSESTTYKAKNGKYNVVYAGPEMSSSDWDEDDCVFNGVTFSNSFVPMVAADNSNRLTLDPCCAVIRGNFSDIAFFDGNPENGGSNGTVSGQIWAEGSLDPANKTIIGTTEIDYSYLQATAHGNVEDGYMNYVILPLSDSVKAWLQFDMGTNTTHAVTLKRGVIYTVNL